MESVDHFKDLPKKEKLRELRLYCEALCDDSLPSVSQMANIAAAIKDVMHWWWIGFYLVRNDSLVLGPFQGPVACTKINFGKGVCGTSWQTQKSILVENVDLFPGHIACSAQSKSELVVPIFRGNEVIGVIDADSEYLSHFDQSDLEFLESIAKLIEPNIRKEMLT